MKPFFWAKWLSTDHYSDRKRCASQRRDIAHEVKRTKNACLQEKAQKVEMRYMEGREFGMV